MAVLGLAFRASWSRRMCGATAAAAFFLASGAWAADPAADLEAQYQTAVAVLKKPPITGILITEVEPESAAAAHGMRAGDILTEYYGTKVTTLEALREQVAEALARRIEDETAGKAVLARVRRGDEERLLTLPREVLGVRAVEVQAGVPGPRNPPPNPRGTLALDWNAVLQTVRGDGEGGPAAFRLLERTEPVPDATQPQLPAGRPVEDWIGWELCSITADGDEALVGTVEVYHVMPAAAPPADDDQTIPTEHSTFTFHLHLGDYKTAPAFVLEETGARYNAPPPQENMQVAATAKRLGEKLQMTSELVLPGAPAGGNGGGRVERHENSAPLNAVPQYALPWIAAALPQEEGDALGLYLLSVRDFLPRPGYVLATRGRALLPFDPEGAEATATSPAAVGWRVDLVYCGVVIESYWFTDQRRLVCVQTQGPQSLVARRAANASSAAVPMERKTQTRPARGPAATAG